MEKLKSGEIIELNNNKEYIVFSQLVHDGVDYVYLMSNFKPLEIKFAKQFFKDNQLMVEEVSDSKLKKDLLELFQNKKQ